MYQNAHFLNHFFALLDFRSRDEERRTKGERISQVEEKSEALISKSAGGGQDPKQIRMTEIQNSTTDFTDSHRFFLATKGTKNTKGFARLWRSAARHFSP